MANPQDSLDFVHTHCPENDVLVEKLRQWCDCNSGSHHPTGVHQMAELLLPPVDKLASNAKLIDTPTAYDIDPITGEKSPIQLGPTLHASKRPDAPIQILLNGHMDTVYGPESPFQACHISADGQHLHGPGVADMKGGLLVMLEALALFEQHPDAHKLGWEILITPDEEIGSPGSEALLKEAAARNHLGMIYESSPPGGSLVRSRMGGGNFLLRAHGHSVHVGKNFTDGRNAIAAIADCILAVQACNQEFPEARFNTGVISGGEVLNAVPEYAHARFNIRYSNAEDAEAILERLEAIRAEFSAKHDLELHWSGTFNRPAKNPNATTKSFYHFIRETGTWLDMELPWHDTGGGADGSNLLAYGLPNIDNLGVIGANLHSPEEYMKISSLTQRIQLSTLLLIRLAQGDFPIDISQ